MLEELRYAYLKDKQRDIRDGFPSELGLRVHRAISWLGRAEMAPDDPDVAFIFYWISFNAAYASDQFTSNEFGERFVFSDFFDKVVELDPERLIYKAIWDKFTGPIRLLLDNRYVFQPFWNHHNQAAGSGNWEESFNQSRKRINRALRENDTKFILSVLFDRLYVLRNQLVHGGSTWNSSVNRSQVQDGARILAFLVPLFIDLMMDNPDMNWGAPFYPVVE